MTITITINQKIRLIGFRIGLDEKEVPIQELSPLDYDFHRIRINAVFRYILTH